MKYPIKKEFFPYYLFKPPVVSPKLCGFLGGLLRPPRSVWRDKHVEARKARFISFDKAEVEVILFRPRGVEGTLPCLVYYHGGAFYFGAAWYHYRMARQYAVKARCQVVFVQYRRTPKHAFPIPVEDCFSAYEWTVNNAKALGVDRDRIAVGGDSAGGSLAAGVCLMARDRGVNPPLFQMLIYPVLDRRMNTVSHKVFTHSPVWNSRLSKGMWEAYLQGDTDMPVEYASPVEAKSFVGLPPAYIEVAEVDCLRDEGMEYGSELVEAGVEVERHEARGAMHGFDVASKAPTTVRMTSERIVYMKKKFGHALH